MDRMRERASSNGRVRDCMREGQCATECMEGDGVGGIEGRGRGVSNESLKQMHHDLPSPPRHTVTTVEDEMVLRRAR